MHFVYVVIWNCLAIHVTRQVVVAAAERCLEAISLDPAVLDRLIQVKLEKSKEQTPTNDP